MTLIRSGNDGNGKLRILLLGSHLGYNLEHYVKSAFERLGCEVRFVGYRGFLGHFAIPLRMLIARSEKARELIAPFALSKFNKAVKSVGSEFDPELVLSVKGEAVLPKTIDWFSHSLGAVTALWCPDDPRYFNSLSRIIALAYDFVFASSERIVPEYRNAGVQNVEWLPFACDPSVHRPVSLSNREIQSLESDVCFVGTFSRKRARMLKALERARFKVSVWGPYWKYVTGGHQFNGPAFGHDMARIFSAAKIVLNVHDQTDVGFKPNMRTFEATGCRTLLLSDMAFSLERFFTPYEEVVCYTNEIELVELARLYLEAPAERAIIADKGHIRAYRDHTYDQRVGEILKIVH
jgi:spore maturation protein CgeB